MEISQIGAGALLGTSINQRAGGASGSPITAAGTIAADQQVDAARAPSGTGSQALDILRAEIRQLLATTFRISFTARVPAYADSGPATPADVAGDALNAATSAAQRSPLEASRTLVDLRQKVEEKAEAVREIVAGENDDDVEKVMSCVSCGLDDMDDEVARNVESSATVLSAESSLKQRSTIRIRTQEGDIVRFDLRYMEKMSAEDVSISNSEMSFTSTQVEFSSRSRMMLRVNGDLNEAEFAAIQNVFAQAEAIADEFFNGDLAAAFDMAAGVEFDSEQLARVNMRFREKLQSQVSFAAIGPVLSQPVANPAPQIEAAPVAEPAVIPVATPATKPETAVQPVEDTSGDPAATVVAGLEDSALDGFLDLLSKFLNATNVGFEPEAGVTSFRYYYSQSFNLKILQSILEFKAPEETADTAKTASSVIDGIVESGEDS